MAASAQPEAVLRDCGLILVRPKYPENIGAAARIACNFGFGQLIVVADEPPEPERMLKMATHKAAHLIERLQFATSSREAAAPYQFLVGTTARQGKYRTVDAGYPREVMTELARLIADGSRAALMFGPESSGLSNEDLDLCQMAAVIPTADFSSLNLAQAVAICCYELFMATGRAAPAGGDGSYANSHELEGMYEHIDQALSRIGFIRDTSRSYWMRNIRQFLSRTRIKKKEASLIRGVCRKFLWHSGGQGWLPPEQQKPPSD
ncbi:tRNA (cytidine/uridine-2'-O-)-methyltransferase TrmJ [Candidatus Electronema halotolerans]|jgi:tRNA/rRNA methyltransferase